MAVLNDHLTVWEIGFRWGGHDPDRLWFRIPLGVRDNFRNLMAAILKAELLCNTISLEKPSSNPNLLPEFSVYRYLDDIEDCIAGHRFNRKLLRWAGIARFDFKVWCERQGISPPEFWFPAGWKLEYELPDDDLMPGHFYMRRYWQTVDGAENVDTSEATGIASEGGTAASPENPGAMSTDEAPATGADGSGLADQEESEERVRANQQAKFACRQIAMGIWRDEPTRTIASVVKDKLIQKYGGASHYADVTVREWIKVVAPLHVRQKRGRPRRENRAEDE